MTTQAMERPASSSRYIAAEFRAEIARQGRTARQIAREAGLGEMWLSRRIGRSARYELTLEEVEMIAHILGMPVERIAHMWVDASRAASPETDGPSLPRLDSNQQPSGYVHQDVAA